MRPVPWFFLQGDYCFNPRICKRCDCQLYIGIPARIVSIHASVKDATYNYVINLDGTVVSIHASVKDATKQEPFRSSFQMFQSTHL